MIFFMFGVDFHITGDIIDRSKPAIIIMNHRTRLDWLFFWNALYKIDPWLLTTEKISLKSSLKRIPGAGNIFCFYFSTINTLRVFLNILLNFFKHE